MARRKAAAVDEQSPISATPADDVEGEAPIRRRRRRRTTPPAAPDYGGETTLVVEAALKSRGAKGATQDVLQNVVNWARSVRTEGDELRVLASRPRRLKTQAPVERTARYEMNKALLDGILTGGITLDVLEDGQIVFIHSSIMQRAELDASVHPEALGASGDGV
jgi:hypothetical protein